MARFRVELDRNVCQGFGACAEICPDYFELSGEDAKSTIKGAEEKDGKHVVEVDELGCYRDAAEACPFKVIQIVETSTGEKLV